MFSYIFLRIRDSSSSIVADVSALSYFLCQLSMLKLSYILSLSKLTLCSRFFCSHILFLYKLSTNLILSFLLRHLTLPIKMYFATLVNIGFRFE